MVDGEVVSRCMMVLYTLKTTGVTPMTVTKARKTNNNGAAESAGPAPGVASRDRSVCTTTGEKE